MRSHTHAHTHTQKTLADWLWLFALLYRAKLCYICCEVFVNNSMTFRLLTYGEDNRYNSYVLSSLKIPSMWYTFPNDVYVAMTTMKTVIAIYYYMRHMPTSGLNVIIVFAFLQFTFLKIV